MLEFLATLAAGIFAGAALYINLVEHPAAMETDVAYAARSFPHRYQRGALMQAPLAVAGFGLGTGAFAMGSGFAWFAGALALGAVVPFTLLIMAPGTNKPLLDDGLDPAAPDTVALLTRWSRLHAVRTLLGAVAFVIFTIALAA